MRPIKFRAWDGRKMHIVGNIHFDQVGGYSFCKTAEENCRILTGAPIMQFTGLHDRNGKEIWEGDILLCSDSGEYFPEKYDEEKDVYVSVGKYEVVYQIDESCGWSGWWLKDFEGDTNPFQQITTEGYCEVLGNIYSNPELLKEKP